MQLPNALTRPLEVNKASAEFKRLVKGVTRQVIDHDVM
jgi:hypothetical protein